MVYRSNRPGNLCIERRMIRDHQTEATRRLGIAHPAGTVSNLGELGSFGAHVLPVLPWERVGETVAALRVSTSRPFAVNLRRSDHDPGGDHLKASERERMTALFAPYFAELGIAQPVLPSRFQPAFAEHTPTALMTALFQEDS